MVNNYDLEWELLKKSQVTDRAPSSIVDAPSADYAIKSDSEYKKEEESQDSQ